MAVTKGKPWTEEEKAWLAERMKEGKTYAEIAAMCGRSLKAVITMGQNLGGYSAVTGRPSRGKRWSDDDVQLAELMLGMGFTHPEIGSAVDRAAGSIAYKVSRRGLKPAPDVQRLDRKLGDRRPWTDDEQTLVALLVDRGWSVTRIAAMLGRTPGSVQTQCSRLGIVGDRYVSKQNPKAKWRKCLCCGQGFMSSWIGNRICSPCKESELFQSAA